MKEKDIERINYRIAKLAWGALFVWWGLVFIIDPLTIGMGAIGTGLIFLGANALRGMLTIPRYPNNYFIGAIAITWGVLDQARSMLSLPSAASLALLLVVFGVAEWMGALLPHLRHES